MSFILEYGCGKVEVEKWVFDVNFDVIVVWVNFYGWSFMGMCSFVEFFFNCLFSGVDVGGFIDVWVSMIYVGYLVIVLWEFVVIDVVGIFYVVVVDGVFKYDFGCVFVECFGFDLVRVNLVFLIDVFVVFCGVDLWFWIDCL